MTIKRVEPASCAKIVGVIYAAIGMLIGSLISLIAVFGAVFSGAQRALAPNLASPMIGVLIGIGAIIVFPIFYGLMGFATAWIGAWLYNLAASKVGGIQIEVEQPSVVI